EGRIGKRVSSQLGPLKLREVKGGRKGRQSYIQDSVSELAERLGPQNNRLFLVGGSWRAIARIDMERRGYPLRVLHEYRMTHKSIAATARYLKDNDLDELRARCGVS